MRERPILFSAPMVRALLDGNKTQTRRVIKKPRRGSFVLVGDKETDTQWWPYESDDGESDVCDDGNERAMACPYGQPGDRLWVREAWARTRVIGAEMVVYREGDNRTDYGGPWKPGIHMFRRDSRILLEITSVSVERLQDISEADAWAEGCARGPADDVGGFFPAEEPDPSGIGHRGWDNAQDWYADLWEEINGDGSWAANPWVWVLSFQRMAS